LKSTYLTTRTPLFFDLFEINILGCWLVGRECSLKSLASIK
jgi:hypothetical protein